MPEPEYQRLFLPGVPHAHGDDILLSGRIQKIREVVSKCGVAVRMVAERMAVEPHIGIHINAVELDGDAFAERLFAEREMFAIPTGAAERVTRGRAAGTFRRERADDWKIRAPTTATAAGRGRIRRCWRWRGAATAAFGGCRRQVFDAPVMRQVHGAPGRVVEGGVFRAGGIRFEEAPAEIEIVLAIQFCRRGGKCRERLDREQATEGDNAESHII